VQPRELLCKTIQYSLALRTMYLGKIKLSYWQEYALRNKNQSTVLRGSSFVEHRDRPGIPHSTFTSSVVRTVRVDFPKRRFKLFLAIGTYRIP
jgi:hypothetical protein